HRLPSAARNIRHDHLNCNCPTLLCSKLNKPQDAEVQSRGRNASCKRPFTHCEGRVPKAERPEEDRDEVLNPAMERRKTASNRRNMGGCCVVEDTDQQVDHDEKPKCAEKGPYISGSSGICCAARAGELLRHLSSPLGGRWKWCG